MSKRGLPVVGESTIAAWWSVAAEQLGGGSLAGHGPCCTELHVDMQTQSPAAARMAGSVR